MTYDWWSMPTLLLQGWLPDPVSRIVLRPSFKVRVWIHLSVLSVCWMLVGERWAEHQADNRRNGFLSETCAKFWLDQVLSDGMLGFMQAKKLTDTPYPFPHAQMVKFWCIVDRPIDLWFCLCNIVVLTHLFWKYLIPTRVMRMVLHPCHSPANLPHIDRGISPLGWHASRASVYRCQDF